MLQVGEQLHKVIIYPWRNTLVQDPLVGFRKAPQCMLHGCIPPKKIQGKHMKTHENIHENTWLFCWVKVKVKPRCVPRIHQKTPRLDEGAKAALKAVPGLQVAWAYDELPWIHLFSGCLSPKTAGRVWKSFTQWWKTMPASGVSENSRWHFFLGGRKNSGLLTPNCAITHSAGTPQLMSRPSAERFGEFRQTVEIHVDLYIYNLYAYVAVELISP